MNARLWIIASVVALLLIRPLLRMVIAMLFSDTIGKQAVAKQPDQIHLDPAGAKAPSDAQWNEWGQAFLRLGFEDCGTFALREMPGVLVRLFANSAESLYASTCLHPKGGRWFEIFVHYTDGTSATFSTLKPTGLAERPGHPSVRDPHANAEQLHRRALAHATQKAKQPVSARGAASDYERFYAEGIAWRKQRGVTRGEVVSVAARKAA
jgi:hypothetical protein